MSGNHNLRVVTPTSSSCTAFTPNSSSSTRLSAHGDEKHDIKKINPELVSNAGMPYHRSMINVSSDNPDIGVPHGVNIVYEKSQSHADLTKSNELIGYKSS